MTTERAAVKKPAVGYEMSQVFGNRHSERRGIEQVEITAERATMHKH